jgi:hypothetical protein
MSVLPREDTPIVMIAYADHTKEIELHHCSPAVIEAIQACLGMATNNEKYSIILEFILERIPYTKHPEVFPRLYEAFLEKNDLYNRLERIIITGDTSYKTKPPHVQSFQDFCQKVPEWGSSKTSYVCFRDDPAFGGEITLKQREQYSALCYLHAPCVLIYYLRRKTDPSYNGLIEISKYIKNVFSGDMLYSHLFENNGGDSLEMLKFLTTHKNKIHSINTDELSVETFEKYGPLLIHSFLVYDDLCDLSISSHTKQTFRNTFYESTPLIETAQAIKQCLSFPSLCGNSAAIPLSPLTSSSSSPSLTPHVHNFFPVAQCVPRRKHALLLIGIRKCGSEYRFLYQNWWDRKQFFESDMWYMDMCEAEIHYIKDPITQILDTELVYGDFVETCWDTFEVRGTDISQR